jgi:hypothetical protein
MTPVEARIAARKDAETAWELLEEVADGQADSPAYWERIRELANEGSTDKPEPVNPMTDVECRVFEKTIIPFGAYKDMQVGFAPTSYLCRLADPSPFINELKRYLQNPDVKRSIAEETEED